MAYRLPTERRDRANDAATLSYLEYFLEQIESLPAQTKTAFSEIRQLDDKVETMVANAKAAADEAITRSVTKGTAIETARRTYHEFIHVQANAKEVADKKLALATSIHASADSVISELDRRLLEFEAQLKRDGRWPGANPQPTTQPNTPDQPKTTRSPTAKAPRPEMANTALPTQSLNTRAAQKARNRDTVTSPPVVPPRTRNAPTSNRGNASAQAVRQPTPEPSLKDAQHSPNRSAMLQTSATVDVVVPKNGAGKISSSDRPPEPEVQESDQDMLDTPAETTPSADIATNREANDGVSVDETLYCSCQRISHGDMIACEGKNCPFEWYHFECVGLKEAPAGMWFCPTCKDKDKKRKSGATRRKYS